MRRMSIGAKRQPVDATGGPLSEVLLRTKNPPPAVGPGFMRRSCTFVTEGSWRKSSFGMGGGQKETKDKVNLALQVRHKATQLTGGCEEDDYLCDLREGGSTGKVSRFVGNLKSWSSSEDVRQSVVGAFARTVNNIKQRPVSKKVKQVLSRTNSSNPDSQPNNIKLPSDKPKMKSKADLRTKPDTRITKQPSAIPKTTKPKSASKKATDTRSPSMKSISKNSPGKKTSSPQDKRWLKHLQDAQNAYDGRGGRRSQAPLHVPDPEESAPSSDHLRDVEDVEEGDNADAGDLMSNYPSARPKQEQQNEASTSTTQNSTNPPANSHSPPSPESLISKKTELLRRKDLKIREELQIKQDIIADILNIPREDFESVADMAGDMGLSNKEPRELVLGSIFQAKKLQEALNEAQTLRECDIMSAQACSDSSRATPLPLYPAPMEKLLSISGNLTQLLNALLSLVSERDDERDRMRKELVASRERLHQLHMQQNKTDPPHSTEAPSPSLSARTSSAAAATSVPASASATDTTSPHSSRPSSFVSVGSSAADQSEVVPDQPNIEEDGSGEEPPIIPLSQNIRSEGNLSLQKCYDTSDGDTGLSQTSISEESEVLRVSASVEPSSPTLAEDTGTT